MQFLNSFPQLIFSSSTPDCLVILHRYSQTHVRLTTDVNGLFALIFYSVSIHMQKQDLFKATFNFSFLNNKPIWK